MTVPSVEGLLTIPYVTVAEFRASPTWLDTDDLIPAGAPAQQDAELYNVLLRASSWADNWCGQRLSAHSAYEQTRARVDRWGRIILHPSNVPVRQVTGVAYGTDFQNLTELTDLTQTWIEDARGIVVSSVPWRGTFSGTLEFGSVPPSGGEVYVAFQYVAGYAVTTLASPATAAQSSIVVANATGIQPQSTVLFGTLPGSTLRVWDPALEEAVTVGTSYTAGATTVPLSAPLINSHVTGTGVSELPPEVHQAVIELAVALLMRENVTDEEPFAGTPYGPTTRQSAAGGAAGGLVDHARELLEPYRRVR